MSIEKLAPEASSKTLLKYRFTGAGIWLLLLIIIVPNWYNNPVNFKPYAAEDVVESELNLVNKAYKIPEKYVSYPVEKQPKTAVVTEVIKEVTSHHWVIQVVTYKDEEDAKKMHGILRYDYDAYIKFFPKNKYYSVRLGPYTNKDEALKDQQKVNSKFHVKSKIIKISQPAN